MNAVAPAVDALPPRLQRQFAPMLVAWQARHGRHALPWQQSRDPYRVWLSEIMLQQTQVSTVLAYYARFLDHFPDVQALAAASLDEVLGLWSGLGYYSRARNLHRCAQAVVAEHGGHFPAAAETLVTLPGIGRSTAAAIAAFCHGERVAILDGNVKRVLTRVLAWGEDLSLATSERRLWALATGLLPEAAADMPGYTQGLMDLGATLCTARQPRCEACPVLALCAARQADAVARYPVKTRKLKRSAESLWLLWAARDDGAVWLVQRPARGVWAGLFCFPVFDSHEALAAALPGTAATDLEPAPPFKHVLTHKDLHLHPVRWAAPHGAALTAGGQWVLPSRWPTLGLPAPVKALLLGAGGGR